MLHSRNFLRSGNTVGCFKLDVSTVYKARGRFLFHIYFRISFSLTYSLNFILHFLLLRIFWLALFSSHFRGTLSVLFWCETLSRWGTSLDIVLVQSSRIADLFLALFFSLHFLAWFRFSCSMSIQHLPRVMWWVTLLYVVFPSVSYTSTKASYLLHSKDANFYLHLHDTL